MAVAVGTGLVTIGVAASFTGALCVPEDIVTVLIAILGARCQIYRLFSKAAAIDSGCAIFSVLNIDVLLCGLAGLEGAAKDLNDRVLIFHVIIRRLSNIDVITGRSSVTTNEGTAGNCQVCAVSTGSGSGIDVTTGACLTVFNGTAGNVSSGVHQSDVTAHCGGKAVGVGTAAFDGTAGNVRRQLIQKSEVTQESTAGEREVQIRSVARVGNGGDIVIPDGITAINESVFWENESVITSVKIPSSVKSIGDMAFYGCTKLDWFSCGTALKHIGTRALWNAKKLSYLKFSPTLETIGDYAFANCELLPSLVFPDSLKSIGLSAFSNCKAIETITFGTGELTIGAYAFENCTLLTEVTIPMNVVSIGRNAFAFRETDSTETTHTVKINCHLGSAGVDYSVKNNAPVYIIELDRTINSFGDIDNSGSVTTVDARKALRIASGMDLTVTEDMLFLADLNQNGYIDLEDADIILQRAAGI